MPNILKLLYNFHWVERREIARSAQAFAGGLGALLSAENIHGIVNLRGANPSYGWWHGERAVAQKLGVAHFDAMLDSRKLPTRAMLMDLLAAFDNAPRPFLVKCSGGQDRTSFACALYLIHSRGWGLRRLADKQFARWPYLHFPKKHQRWLRRFFDYAQTSAKAAPIAQWIAADYDPQHFAQWLDANGARDSYKGVFDKPVASRWQW